MNKLELKEYTSEHVIYYYQPEGNGEKGEIIYAFNTDEPETLKQAEKDGSGRYGHKACNKVKEYIDKNNLPIRSTQAWY